MQPGGSTPSVCIRVRVVVSFIIIIIDECIYMFIAVVGLCVVLYVLYDACVVFCLSYAASEAILEVEAGS